MSIHRLPSRGMIGNHEFGAVHFQTEHPAQPGQFLSEQDAKNRGQRNRLSATMHLFVN